MKQLVENVAILFFVLFAVFPVIGFSQDTRPSRMETHTLPNGKVYVLTQTGIDYRIDSARHAVFIPDGIKSVRGIFIHQHGCTMEGRGLSTAFDLQYQAFAKKWGLIVIGPDLYAKANCHDWKDPASGSAQALFKTLKEVSRITGQGEIADAPWLLWGHSGGGYWSQAMMKEYPERIMAVFSYSPGLKPDWEYPKAALKIPIMIRHAGPVGDECCWQTALKTFDQLRPAGGYASIVNTSHQHHNFSYVRYISIPFFESVLVQRLPDDAKRGYKAMRDMDPDRAWLADTTSLNIYKAGRYPYIKNSASWLPDSIIAVKWREYAITGTITDRTAPTPPYDISANRRHNMSISVSWKADADIESGISHFNIYREDQLVSRFPATGEYQRFDTNGDDAFPVFPLPMQTDITNAWNDKGRLFISVVNRFGLESERVLIKAD